MTQQGFTNEQLSTAFHNYLVERFDGDIEKVHHIIDVAENIIPNTLNDYFGTHIVSIYEMQDSEEVENFRKKIKIEPILKGIDLVEEPRYTDVLLWYKYFVKALNADTIPVPVPGEYKLPSEDEKSQSPDSGNKQLPKQQTTIFTEGEEDGTITSEHRRRNMELRQACIDIFKAKHGGRIVCECCGFEFGRAYDIKDEYIEVHHRFPFAHTEGAHPVDAETDLVPLCANCHRMIHHGQGGKGKCMSLDDLKNIYRGKTYKNL